MEKQIKKIKKLVAIYARVSTAKQEEEQTIQNQLMSLKELAEKNNYSVVEKYIDNGWSGDILARPELDRLREDARSKKWEAVIIYDPDRLARRYTYQQLVMDELTEADIEVIFITMSPAKNPEEKILQGVRGIFAEYERAKIAERFRQGKLRKIKEGHILLSEAPYGYNYIPKKNDKHGYIEVNPEEARIVKMIFSWVANDKMTLRNVVKKLKDLGIKPRRSKRGVWNTSTLSSMLRNEVYIGKAHWGSSEAVIPKNPIKKEKYKKIKKSSRKTRPEDQWFSIPVAAILDKKLFEKTREQLKRNYDQSKRNRKNKYLLSNLIYCSCGRKRMGEGACNGKHLYYRCTDRVLSFPLPRTCMEGGFNARIADQMVWDKLVEIFTSPELLKKQMKRFNNKTKKEIKNVGDIGVLEKEISKVKEEEMRYNKAYGSSVLTLEELNDCKVLIRERLSSLRKQIEEVKEENIEVAEYELPNDIEIGQLAKMFVSMVNMFEYEKKREFVLKTVDKVEGTPSKLLVRGKLPLLSSPYVEYQTSHRYCRSSKRGEIHAF